VATIKARRARTMARAIMAVGFAAAIMVHPEPAGIGRDR
jgi:hypothetical protein